MSESSVMHFEGSSGVRLSGRLHATAVEPIAYAVFAHCFTCSKESKAARYISASLAELGIATLRFDFTGLGESEGDFSETTFSQEVADVEAAAAALRERYAAPALLIGHSLGGAAVLAAASRIPEAVGIATIAAPAEPQHVAHLLGTSIQEIEREGEAEVKLGGRPFKIRKKFLDDLEAQCSAEKIRDLEKALLIFHSPQDKIVDVDNARIIYQAARHPKSFVSLDGADHLLLRREDSEYVATVLKAWATRYLPEIESVDVNADASEGEVVVEGKTTGLVQRVQARHHLISADEPLSLGGTDRGLNPYELLLASLGACTSMTLKMYAERKKWPLEGVSVRLRHGRVHAKDCEDCETETGLIDVIEKEVKLEGKLDQDQRDRLFEIAARCPVHRTLVNEVKIRSSLVEE